MTDEVKNIGLSGVLKKIPSAIVLFFIYVYRCFSPLFGPCCRFRPTCSEYGLIAVKRFGAVKGMKLTLKRLAKCRPKGSYGYDPVPETYPDSL